MSLYASVIAEVTGCTADEAPHQSMMNAYCETVTVTPWYERLDKMISNRRIPFQKLLSYWNAEARRHDRHEPGAARIGTIRIRRERA